MAEWLALLILDHKALNPTGGEIELMTMAYHCTEPLIVTLPLSWYDLNGVERDIKHQNIWEAGLS